MDKHEQLTAGQFGGDILDVATGRGFFAHWMMENLQDVRSVTGIDESDKGFEQAQELFGERDIKLLQMSAARIGLPDASFDTVGICNSIHHLADRYSAMCEMSRVLRPGGTFLLTEMYRDDLTETQQTHAIMHHWWGEIDRSLGISHFKTFRRAELLELLEWSNLEVEVVIDHKDLTPDPKAPETLEHLDKVIDQYLERAGQTANREHFCRRGEEIRARLHDIGFHSATLLTVRGRKPVN
ncbi:methyltransferase domain-containing protein [bacterium]|nr:methyltransferase domain-containing protein [bacterium]